MPALNRRRAESKRKPFGFVSASKTWFSIGLAIDQDPGKSDEIKKRPIAANSLVRRRLFNINDAVQWDLSVDPALQHYRRFKRLRVSQGSKLCEAHGRGRETAQD